MSDVQEMNRRFPVPLFEAAAYATRAHAGRDVGNCVISLSGRIDESRLRRAIRLAMDAEPILGCRFAEHPFRPYWQRRTDLDDLPLCEVVEGDRQCPAFRRFLAEALDPAADPLLKAVVFRGAGDVVCLKATHAVMDGPSMAKAFLLVFDIYRRLKREPGYAPEPRLDAVRSMKELTEQWSFGERLRMFRTILSLRSAPVATWLFPEPKEEPPFGGYVLLKLPPERVRALSRYGRDRRATITSIMLAAGYFAARDVFQLAADDVATFSTTADLRRFLPAHLRDTSPSNISAPARFVLHPHPGESFEEVLTSLRDQLKVILKDPARIGSRMMSLLMAFPAIRLFFRALPLPLIGRMIERYVHRLAERPERRWGIANLGVIEPETLDFEAAAVEDAYILGPLFAWPGMALTFSIFQDRLTLAAGIAGRVVDEAVARRFFEQIDRRLPFYADSPGSVSTLPDPSCGDPMVHDHQIVPEK